MARFWTVIPAAGIGRRMGASIPKQYLTLANRPVIAHTMECFIRHPRIDGVVAVIADDDRWWPEVAADIQQRTAATPIVAPGGVERYQSVLNGLQALSGRAEDEDWVLVHDAVRPCVRAQDIDRLLAAGAAHSVGALLALPVRDTMKRSSPQGEGSVVKETVSRDGLWHAQTPQMFRLGALAAALTAVLGAGRAVTDEAQAMEFQGKYPLLVPGHPENIKITVAEDLELAELFLGRCRDE